MPCPNAECGKGLGFFSRKRRLCGDCGIELCKQCIVKTPATSNRTRASKLCSRCNSLALVPLMDQASLLGASEDVLKLYLTAFGVSTAGLTKNDIIRLVEQTRNAADLASTVVDPSNTTVTSRTFSVSHEFGGLQDEDPSRRGAADTVSTASASSAEAESDANPPPAASHAYSDLPQMPNLNGLEGAFAEQLIQLLMSAVQTEQAPRQTDEEYQREQAALRAKQKEMVARKENANVLNTAKSPDEFGNLRVGQLKDILAENFVDYQHCIEKSELLDKVEALWRERQTADEDGDKEDAVCRICFDKPINAVFLECGHFCTCVDCGKQLKECPMCRQNITRCVHVFKS